MKAIIKTTGEVVEILSWGSDGTWTKVEREDGTIINTSLNYYKDFKWIDETNWQKYRNEVAKDIMVATYKNWLDNEELPNVNEEDKRCAAIVAVEMADALILELKK